MNRIQILVLIAVILLIVKLSTAGSTMAFDTDIRSEMNLHDTSPFKGSYVDLELPSNGPVFKSKMRARLYSVAGTTIPLALARLNARGYGVNEQSGTSIVLIASGIIVGPSSGSIYADDWMLARRSIFVRSASSIILISGYLIRGNEVSESLGTVFMISGGLFLSGHILYDILFLSAHSVDYYNARVRVETGLTLQNIHLPGWDGRNPSTMKREAMQLPGLGFRIHF